jgi:hypothetical protein
MSLHHVFSWLSRRLRARPAAVPGTPSAPRPVPLQIECLEAREVPTNAAFVTALYTDLLGRVPDPFGLAFFTSQLNLGVSRQLVASTFLASPEFQVREVNNLYLSLLGRPADPFGAAFFLGFLRTGATFQQVEATIIGSDEFFIRNGATIGGFLNALYGNVLGRPIDPIGVETWGTAMLFGAPRISVAFLVASSLEGNQVTVANLYRTLLGRQPDPAGLSFFTNSLATGARVGDVTAAILGSNEFFNRQ